MLKFLLDANLSWETAEFIKSLGYQAETVAHFGLSKAEDKKIIELANQKKMILITLDLDFSEMYYFSSEIKTGIIILRLRNQTIESVNAHLKHFFESKIIKRKRNQQSLIIIEEGKIRIKRR